MMKITGIRIKRNSKPDGHYLGTASIQLDGCLLIHGIKLYEMKGKRIVSFPNKKIKKFDIISDGGYEEKYEYSDIVHPTNTEFRNYINTEIFRYYDLGGGTENE